MALRHGHDHEEVRKTLIRRARKEIAYANRMEETEKREARKMLEAALRAETVDDPIRRAKIAFDAMRNFAPLEKIATVAVGDDPNLGFVESAEAVCTETARNGENIQESYANDNPAPEGAFRALLDHFMTPFEQLTAPNGEKFDLNELLTFEDFENELFQYARNKSVGDVVSDGEDSGDGDAQEKGDTRDVNEGERLRVWWSEEKTWFWGTVVRRRWSGLEKPRSLMHHVTYDVRGWEKEYEHILFDEVWQTESEGKERETEQDREREREYEADRWLGERDFEAEDAASRAGVAGGREARRARRDERRPTSSATDANAGKRQYRKTDDRNEVVWAEIIRAVERGRKRGCTTDEVGRAELTAAVKRQRVMDAADRVNEVLGYIDSNDFGRIDDFGVTCVSDMAAAREVWRTTASRKRKRGTRGSECDEFDDEDVPPHRNVGESKKR